MCWLCFVRADSVRRGSGFMYSLCFVGAAWPVGLCVGCGSCERTRYGAARGGQGYVFAVFLGSGLGTA
jgi:hypothetical protein